MSGHFAETLEGPLLVPKKRHEDLRGLHVKLFGQTPEDLALGDYGLDEVFFTVNHKNTLRGLHFQVDPSQPKLLSCVMGQAVVNVVNLLPKSPYFLQTYNFVLTGEDLGGEALQVLVPPGHALGYRCLEEATVMLYLAGAPFSATGDVGIDPLDETLSLDWGPAFKPSDILLSERDKHLPSLAAYLETLGVTIHE